MNFSIIKVENHFDHLIMHFFVNGVLLSRVDTYFKLYIDFLGSVIWV